MFSKDIITNRGFITTFHGISEVLAKFPSDIQLSVTVSSFSSEGDYLQGQPPLKKTSVVVPFSAIGNNFTKSLEQWIVASPDNIFYGGNVKNAYSTDNVIYAQDKQIAILKDVKKEKLATIDYDGLNNTQIQLEIDTIKNHYTELKDLIMLTTDIPSIEAITWDTIIP